MNKQTCTLKQAIRLKQLGVTQDACMIITYYKDTMKFHVNRRETALNFYKHAKEKFGSACNTVLVSGYDAEELFAHIKGDISIERDGDLIRVDNDNILSQGATLTEALANLLIWQLENK